MSDAYVNAVRLIKVLRKLIIKIAIQSVITMDILVVIGATNQ